MALNLAMALNGEDLLVRVDRAAEPGAPEGSRPGASVSPAGVGEATVDGTPAGLGLPPGPSALSPSALSPSALSPSDAWPAPEPLVRILVLERHAEQAPAASWRNEPERTIELGDRQLLVFRRDLFRDERFPALQAWQGGPARA